jgi:hypothetical protein
VKTLNNQFTEGGVFPPSVSLINNYYLYQMKKFVIYLFLFVLVVNTLAQNTFFNTYRTPQIERSFDAIMASDGSLIVVGIRSTSITYEDACGLVMKFDEYGNFVNETTLVNQKRTFFYNIEKVPNYDNEYIIIGSSDSIVGDDYHSTIMITRIDDQLNIISQNSFHPINHYRLLPLKFTFIDDSTMILLIGRIIIGPSSPPQSLMITEVRLPADSIKSFLSDSTIRRIPGDITYIPKSDEIHVAYYGQSLDNDSSSVKILRLDSLLNHIETLQSPSRAFSTACTTELTDSTYLLTATSRMSSSSSSWRTISAFVMDAYGNGLKGVQYYNHPDTALYGGFSENAAIVNGSIFLIGVHNIDPWGVPYQSTPTWIQVTKLDMELNILNHYFYGGDAAYYPYCILPASDGGAYITGIVWDFQMPKQLDIFVMKVNSDGIIVNVPENTSFNMSEALVYPNPAQDFVIVDFSLLYKTANLQLIDLAGRTILERALTANHQQVDISGVPAGAYVYRIFNSKGLEESGKLVVE